MTRYWYKFSLLAHFAPNGGESLQQLFERVENWLNDMAAQNSGQKPVLAVGHAGWITAAKMIDPGQNIPKIAADWPASVAYGGAPSLAFSFLSVFSMPASMIIHLKIYPNDML
ncbi:phosphoglycerate mutase family protein [Psychrobacter sp. VH5]|uniref:phosphoglycerate mutase family protein n=1 Tax=Psychrobacter sp. VH5 TaxID=3423439 RepID=UPI003D6619EB